MSRNKHRTIRVYNLDESEILTTFFPPVFAKNITMEELNIQEEIETRLGIPVDSQVFYGKKLGYLRDMQVYTQQESRYKPTEHCPEIVKLAVRGFPKDTEHAVEINQKLICPYISNIYIRDRIGGEHQLKCFDSASFTTLYRHVKLFIEENYKIPVENQILFRQGTGTCVMSLDDEYIVDYLFDYSEILPEENVIFLLLKENDDFRFDDVAGNIWLRNELITFGRIKPISIVSRYREDFVTKLMTFSPEEVQFSMIEIKLKIQERFGIPTKCQMLYTSADKCHLSRNGEVLQHSLLPCLFLFFFITEENEFEIYLSVDAIVTRNDKYKESILEDKTINTCREYNIKLLEIKLLTPMASKLIKQVPVAGNFTVEFLKENIERYCKIPVKCQLLFGPKFDYLKDQTNLWDYFYLNMLLEHDCIVHIVVTEDIIYQGEAVKICKELEIPQVSPYIFITPLNGTRDIHKVHMNQLREWKGNQALWLKKIKDEICRLYSIPVHLMFLSYRNEVIPYSYLTSPIEKLFFNDGVLNERITFELTFEASVLPGVVNFCERFSIPRLNRIEIRFLTSQLFVKFEKNINSISDLKRSIEEIKNIPIISQELKSKNRILNDDEMLIHIFVRDGDCSSGDLSISGIIKRVENVAVYIECPYLTLPVIQMSGSDTILKLKEKIMDSIGLPVDSIRIFQEETMYTNPQEINNDSFIYKFQISGSTRVNIEMRKILNIELSSVSGKEKVTKEYCILEQYATVKDTFSQFDEAVKIQKQCPVSEDSLLIDLDYDFVIKLIDHKHEKSCVKPKCTVM